MKDERNGGEKEKPTGILPLMMNNELTYQQQSEH